MTASKKMIVSGVAAVAALGALWGGKAVADLGDNNRTAACCQLTTSAAVQALRGNDLPGDEQFFTTNGPPADVHFLVDVSCSMHDLPQVGTSQAAFWNDDWAPDNGDRCTNSRLLAVEQAKGWDPSTVYPYPDQGTGLGADNGFPNLFVNAYVYKHNYWRDTSSPPNDAYFSGTNPIGTACTSLHSSGSSDWNSCVECLREKGFYKRPGSSPPAFGDYYSYRMSADMLYTGNFLNFNPPKYVQMKVALKRVVADLRKVRLGMTIFSPDDNGGMMVQQQEPACDQLLRDNTAWANSRASFVNSVNGLWLRTDTPLAESLLNIGQYFSSTNDIYLNDFGFAPSYLKTSFTNPSLTNPHRSWCWGCQRASVIILTDGMPTTDSNLPLSRLSVLNGGPVRCPDYNLDGQPDCIEADPADPDNASSYLDDVAKVLHDRDLQRYNGGNPPGTIGDLDTTGKQSLDIYTIGFGTSNALLRHTAEVGGGEFHVAVDAAQLEREILNIVSSIQTRTTSFAATAIASLQVNRAGGTLLPQFRPANPGEPWRGFLYRFDMGSELVLGCKDGGTGDRNDLNHDGDCNDVFLLSADGGAVTENSNGDFVMLNDTNTLAQPYWEASAVLQPPPLADGGMSYPTPVWTTRKIWTVVDSNGDNRIDSNDTPIAFDEAHADALREYLGIPDDENTCPELAMKMGVGAAMEPIDCARAVIRYYRGADVLNPNPGLRGNDRPHLLGDIFHSAPISVEAPTPKFFCGFSTQCLPSLFKTSTDLARYQDPANPGGTIDAYDAFVAAYGRRDKIALVGANDGMLHAFQNGRRTGLDLFTGLNTYNAGTGEELWAFIPPDQLPKLKDLLGTHGYFVDGTTMVRDVWLDGVGGSDSTVDNKKQKNEFRTVAIVSEGEGGSHRVALDLSDSLNNPPPAPGPTQVPNVKVLWVWPQPCDSLTQKVGESTANFAPRPPPIGPVAVDGTGAQNLRLRINGVDAKEEWIAFFNGGYDKFGVRGRGLAMVRLRDGATVWNKFFGDGSALAEQMRYPFAATVSMLDVGSGSNSSPDNDYLFDTATVGDYGGAIWTVRFWTPGAFSSGQITNWHAGRAFQQTASGPDILRQPFAHMTANTLQPETGYLRTYVGTGDRFHVADIGAPICRVSNPAACTQLGCDVSVSKSVTRGSQTTTQAMALASYALQSTSDTTSGTAGAECSGADMRMTWTIHPANACTFNDNGTVEYRCGNGVDGAQADQWNCAWIRQDWAPMEAHVDGGVTRDRYYGFWSYGAGTQRVFDTEAQARAYDTARYTDTSLVDVTSATVDLTGGAPDGGVSADPVGPGWLVRYNLSDERTATGSAIIDGCVLWNSFSPRLSDTAVCATSANNVAVMYQSDFVTGLPNCATGFYNAYAVLDAGMAPGWSRRIERTSVALPGEPTSQRTIVNGLVSSGAAMREENYSGSMAVRSGTDLVQSVYQLEVGREEHNCRHEGLDASCR